MLKYTISLLLISYSTNFTCAQSTTELNVILDNFIEEGMAEWEIPGLAVAVIKEGEIVFIKGYGINKLGEEQNVDTRTMFMIGSTTKAMTAVALAMLVDEGKITWDDKIMQHMPEFQLYDPYVTRELTVLDLLTHRAGIGNTDLLWLTEFDSDEVLYQMRYAKPAYSFRAGYTYQNLMWAAAGKLVEKLSNKSWEAFMQERIFDPLGMDRSIAISEDLESHANYVSPHYKIDGEIQVIERINATKIAPAGDVWSSIEDMAKWTAFMIDSGKVDGKRLLEPETYSELIKPQTIVSDVGFYPTASLTRPRWKTYAMGWFQHDYKQHDLTFHTGSLWGLIAIIGIIPDENFGVYVLGNLDHAELRHAVMYKAIDLYVDHDNSRDWHREIFDLYEQSRIATEKRKEEAVKKRVKNTTPTLDLKSYEGVYTNQLYGSIRISSSQSGLTFHYGPIFSGSLNHWNYDTFEIQWEREYIDNALCNFNISSNGEVGEISIFGKLFLRK